MKQERRVKLTLPPKKLSSKSSPIRLKTEVFFVINKICFSWPVVCLVGFVTRAIILIWFLLLPKNLSVIICFCSNTDFMKKFWAQKMETEDIKISVKFDSDMSLFLFFIRLLTRLNSFNKSRLKNFIHEVCFCGKQVTIEML